MVTGAASVGGMTNTLRSNIALKDFSELFAAVPHLVGYTPTNSLVLITLHGRGPLSRFGLVLRADLPESANADGFARQLVQGPLRASGAESVLLLVVGEPSPGADSPAVGSSDEDLPDAGAPKAAAPSANENDPATMDSAINDLATKDSAAAAPRDERATDHGPPGGCFPPHADLIDALSAALRDVGVEVVHAAWTAEVRLGQQWVCYDEDRCRGEVFDPAISPVGTALAANGSVTFQNRTELEQLVAPESDDALARRSAKLDALAEDTEQDRGSSACPRRDCETVFAAIRRTAAGAALTEDDLLKVMLALSDNRVRDFALSSALDDTASAAEQLWTTLVRKAPSPELADVAALLAVSAYLRGDGALAGVALERIERTRPEHRLGVLLRRTLDLAIPMDDLATIVRDAAEDARTLMAEEDSW